VSARAAWHIITGEFPPDPGGVSDYTEVVARALVEAGDQVHVWAPGDRERVSLERGISIHRLAGRFGPRAIAQLARGLDDLPAPRRLLVQYVPNAFGMKGMNVPFCAWLASRQEKLWVMFHEVATPWNAGKLRRDLPLGVVTRFDAALIAKRADEMFVSVPAWEKLLASFVPGFTQATWSPIPSNFPDEAKPELVDAALAKKKADGAPRWIGHFGTYGGLLAPMLAPIIERLLRARNDRRVILLGRGAEKFAKTLPSEVRENVLVPNASSPDEIVAQLSACDVVLQPYADGISSRRTSVMASIALGLPVISHAGAQTEPIWKSAKAIVLAHDESTRAYVDATESLLADPDLARAVGEKARSVYRVQFSIERTIRVLREKASQEERHS
jgi:glycosyltransferase involved in cell wall biosynthesis